MTTNRKTNFYRASALLAALSSSASGQLTWEGGVVDPQNLEHPGAASGPWDLTSLVWNDVATPLVVWDNSGNQQATFTPTTTLTKVNIADTGVTVGDLLVDSPIAGDILSLESETDNLGLITIKAGGATWDTSGAEIELVNNLRNITVNDGSMDISIPTGFDTPLSISAGDTLTLVGGGTFDTGERPGGANWVAAGATLDVTEATTVRGNAGSIGQFVDLVDDTVDPPVTLQEGVVKLADGSTYIHERNADQTYTNNWELGTGTVNFDNRFSRNYTLAGDISGDGGMRLQFMGNRGITINGTNTFTGDIEVSNASRLSATTSGIGSAGNIVLSGSTATNGGILRLFGVALGSRTVTLNGTGGAIVNGGVNSLDGDIVGDGNLQIGSAAFNTNVNVITLSGSGDYTGSTRIYLGSLILGADEAMGSGVLTIGGGSNGSRASRLILNGHTQTVTGLATADSNTRQIVNLNSATTGSTAGTLILDIADEEEVDEEYFFGAALGLTEADDRGNLNLVKNGDGAIGLGNVRIAGTVGVNAGQLRIGNSADISVVGAVTNNAALVVDEATTASSFTSGPGSSTTFNWEVSDWTGAAGTGYTQLIVTGDVTLDPTSSLTITVDDILTEEVLTNFTESNASFTVVTVGGTPTLSPSQITLDTSGFTSGTGTWDLRVDGSNIVLDYIAGTASGPYDTWAAGFAGLTGGFDDDDDNDGIANGLEYYFFNSDPTVANSLPSPLTVVSAAGSGNLVFSHDRPVDDSDITATYEWSTTLDGDWTASGVENGGTTVTITPGTPTAAATGYETVEVTTSSIPATLEKVFVRLSVSQP